MYKQRRNALMQQIEGTAIALLFSGNAPYRVGDEKYDFSVDRNFYYYTGLDKENMIMIMIKHGNIVQEHLCIEPFDEEQAKWVGGKMLAKDASNISQISSVHWIEEALPLLNQQLTRVLQNETRVPVYADFSRQEVSQQDSQAVSFVKQLQDKYPQIQSHNLYAYTAQNRLVKDESEIEKLKKATAITKEAIAYMMENVKPSMGENELEAYFDFILKKHNCKHSFPSIVAGGKNATILHYVDNNQKIKKDSLVLLDLGASYEYINADISRTFPISGKFTKRQRELYDIVLRCNKFIMSLVKPGITLSYLQAQSVAFYEKELAPLGLLKRGKTVHDYYWHGVSHMLGLETHDVNLPGYTLAVGNVFTIEPGLYLEDESIGIRIEDNVVVTKDGCINLSQDIIKEIDEIEAFMAKQS